MANAQRDSELTEIISAVKEPKRILALDNGGEAASLRNDALLKYLLEIEEYSGIDEADKEKEKVITELGLIVDEWMKEVNKKKNQNGIAKVVLYGSKASKTSLKSDDIDMLVVAPSYIDRKEHFFGDFYNILLKNPMASCLLAITRAIVPIIKCDYQKHRLDIGFVTVDFDLKQFDLASDEILRNDQILASPSMDENMIKSFNAFRNAHIVCRSLAKDMPIEGLLPADQRLTNYRITLLCVKLWAKRIGVYGGILGYFGGISLAIMVAKICQLYPNRFPAELLQQFFFTYMIFPWQEIPVIVEPLMSNTDLDYVTKGKGYFRMDDFLLSRPLKKTAYVISPAFPPTNTTYNVSESQLKIIESHFTEAFKVIRLIMLGELEWEDLFLSYPFFHDFDHFLEVEILSKDIDSFHKWKGLIQARLRYLLGSFEQDIEPRANVSFRLWPQDFNVHLKNQPEYKYACFYYIGMKCNAYSPEVVNLTQVTKQWKSSVYEQWDGETNDNLVFFLSKKRNELDTFVYEPIPKDLYIYTGDRSIFPQEKDSSNLLSKLMTPENQAYLSNNLSYMLGGMQGNSSSNQMQGLMQFGQMQQPQQGTHEHFSHSHDDVNPSN